MNFAEQLTIERIKAALHMQGEEFRTVLAMEAFTYRGVMLINGGAAIALLAFTGNIWSSGQANSAVQSLSIAILCFSGGVLASMCGTAFSYFIQFRICVHNQNDALHWWEKTAKKMAGESMEESEPRQRRHPWSNRVNLAIAVFLITLATAFFCLGVWKTYQAFTSEIVQVVENPVESSNLDYSTSSPESAAAFSMGI